jgi:hypothetical protein
VKENISSLSSSNNTTLLVDSASIYPGKSKGEIEAHITAIREIKEKSVKAHTIISALG